MDPSFLNTRVLKSFRHVAPQELPEAPVYALKGLSEKDATLLYDSFFVKTIRDLADLKYVHWAQEICALRDVPQAKIDMSSFEDKLIKAYEQTPIKRLMRAPVHSLMGVSPADGKRLEQAFRVRTVQNLARLKFARFAQEICREAYADLSAPIRPGDTGGALPPVIPSKDRGGQNARLLLLAAAALVAVLTAAVIFVPRFWRRVASGTVESTKTVPGPAAAGGTYTVRHKDTLFEVSKRVYGTPDRWPEIQRLNRQSVRNPNRIFPGTTLRLPK